MRHAVSAREQQVHEAMEHLGNATLVGESLGISRVTVEVTLAHYHQKACSRALSEAWARISALEEENEALRSRAPRTIFLDHRRVADGGMTKRDQMRAASS